jgi:hypothetical protein
LLDLNLVQQKSAHLGGAEFGGGPHEEPGELAGIE